MGEMADALLLSSQRVVPQKLTTAGYSFASRNLKDALETIFA
jgi:NAD dependent epimerase/dehydratase family enzyme